MSVLFLDEAAESRNRIAFPMQPGLPRQRHRTNARRPQFSPTPHAVSRRERSRPSRKRSVSRLRERSSRQPTRNADSLPQPRQRAHTQRPQPFPAFPPRPCPQQRRSLKHYHAWQHRPERSVLTGTTMLFARRAYPAPYGSDRCPAGRKHQTRTQPRGSRGFIIKGCKLAAGR